MGSDMLQPLHLPPTTGTMLEAAYFAVRTVSPSSPELPIPLTVITPIYIVVTAPIIHFSVRFSVPASPPSTSRSLRRSIMESTPAITASGKTTVRIQAATLPQSSAVAG